MKGSFHMKKQILTGVLLSVLAMSSAYAHKDDKKDAKKPKLGTELVVAHKDDKKDAKKPKLGTELVVAHKDDKKDAKKPKHSA